MRIFGYLIPFCMMPGSWGLKGTTKAIAKAEYELDGIDLERKLIEIRSKPNNEKDKNLALLELELMHENITETEYDKRKAELLQQPWSLLSIKPNPLDTSNRIIVGMEYNDYFISWLRNNGYDHPTEDDSVNAYLNDTYISILEEMNGIDINSITPSHRSNNLEDE